MCIGNISICVEWRYVCEAFKLLYEWFLGGIGGILSFDLEVYSQAWKFLCWCDMPSCLNKTGVFAWKTEKDV